MAFTPHSLWGELEPLGAEVRLVVLRLFCFAWFILVAEGFRASGWRLPWGPLLFPLGPARPLPAPAGHLRECSVSWNLVLVKRTWNPFLLMVSSERNLMTMESPAE